MQALAPDSHTDAPREFLASKIEISDLFCQRPTPGCVRSNTEPATNTLSGILVPPSNSFSGAALALRALASYTSERV